MSPGSKLSDNKFPVKPLIVQIPDNEYNRPTFLLGATPNKTNNNSGRIKIYLLKNVKPDLPPTRFLNFLKKCQTVCSFFSCVAVSRVNMALKILKNNLFFCICRYLFSHFLNNFLKNDHLNDFSFIESVLRCLYRYNKMRRASSRLNADSN